MSEAVFKFEALRTTIPLTLVSGPSPIATVEADGSCTFDWAGIEKCAGEFRQGMYNEQYVVIAKLLHGAKLELAAKEAEDAWRYRDLQR